MQPALIEIENLVKEFGPFAAVGGISFSVAAGEVLGFLGPNGAGKSTTMKMITGYLEPTAGRIRICGRDMAASPLSAQAQIGYLPEGAPAYGEMTPRQFLRFAAEVRGLKGAALRQALERAADLADLGAVWEQPIETLSKGFKRRVGLAQAILHDPPVLIMDEPTDGLDPNQKQAARELIASMAKDKAIIISTHILEEVEAVCTRALIIARGRVVADGTPDELMARSSYHGALRVTVPEAQAVQARQIFRRQTEIRGHEELPAGDARVRFTLLPRSGRSVLEGTLKALSENQIQVDEVMLERGRLDDVFRDLTRPQDATGQGVVA